MTAVGQVLAFALRAIRTIPHDQRWKDWAASQLDMWVITEEDLHSPTPENDEKPPTPYRPLKSARNFVKKSPVRTRSKAARSTCKPTSLLQNSSGEDDNDSESDTNHPSKRPRRPADVMVVVPPPPNRVSSYKGPVCKDGTRRYCTQKCLLGLLNGGPLDRACPNAKEHGTEVHKINHTTFLSLLMAQILQEIKDPWSQPLGCESLHRHGSRGALFEVILFQYGYTLVGKGFPLEFGPYLRHEKGTLRPLAADPRCTYSYIPHLLLLAHAGTEISKCNVAETQIVSAVSEALQAVHALGVLHCDAEERNMFWSEEGENVLVIDFERAKILRRERAPLENTSPNQKRKRGSKSMGGETELAVRQKRIDAKFERELQETVRSLNTYSATQKV
ncbi:predicted protein [Histoplasma mississippiense (nom. inval.)]|uniref:predicted protein n=1 Tax=Ajellomyces capsulatus (strain NAm1 / WU24) TaxID=2059318 RepID=UPI000157BD00|nr:predicted protein [Histoplasma mississippiense (nom. inval.)]EDN05911.1 predicted protein [Histoplasma mississippiense (nom. inval.)]